MAQKAGAMEPVLCMLATVADVRPAFPVWLTPPTAGLLLLFACAIHLSITTFKTWSQLSAFPGPALAAISYLPMLRIRRSGAAHLHYQALSQQHRGGLVRIGPHDLLSADPDHLRRMSSARSAYGRSSWYRATRLDPYHDMMGSTMDKAAHAALRAKMAAGYSGRDNPHLEAELDSQIAALVGLIRRHYVTCRAVIAVPVDFGRLADLYAHDARSLMAFGKPLGMLARNQDVHRIIATARLAVGVIQVFTDIPPLGRIFLSKPMLKLFGPKPSDEGGVGKLLGMAQEHVASRFAPGATQPNDLLGSFLRHGLDRRSAESEVMFPIIAGSDTTAIAIKMTVAYIAHNPRVSTLLQEEIQSAIRDGRLSQPGTSEQTLRLPYLQAVVWEGLRIHPPFGGLIMKQVGPDGDTVDGRYIPAGTRIAHSTWAVTHDVSAFGDDVDTFRPERWLEATDETRSLMKKHTELVFGSGRWGCPGRSVAVMELHKVLVELFRVFNLTSMDDERHSAGGRKQFINGATPLIISEKYVGKVADR